VATASSMTFCGTCPRVNEALLHLACVASCPSQLFKSKSSNGTR